jgi:hypothetical protein
MEWGQRELQMRLEAPDETIETPGLDVSAVLGPVGLKKSLGVVGLPAKSAPDEEALSTHRNIGAREHISR